ncbi:MAG: pilus (MSHA type) biogenesis protein MshL [Gammaproteobacteria bacterium]
MSKVGESTRTTRALLALATAVVVGCAGQAGRETQAGADAQPVPRDVADALLPPLTSPSRAPRAGEQRFDVNVRDLPAQAFFLSLVENTPYNIVVQPGVGGELTLSLRGVTVPEVMDYVRDAFGYDYNRTGNAYTVYAETMQTRVFRVNYLNVRRTGKSRISVSSGQLTDRPAAGAQPGEAAGGGSTGTVAASGIETQSDADFWTEIDATVRTLVPEGNGRKLIVNADAGLVVARAMTSELRNVESYLRTLQANLTRQVILEAKIVEVALSESFQAGINWNVVGATSDGYSGLIGQFGGQNALDDGVSSTAGQQFAVDPATGRFTPIAVDPNTGLTGPSSLPASAIGGAFTALLNVNDFNAVIEMLQGQGDVKVLSSPRVATVNNQKAIIKVGSDEFFVTKVQSNQTGSAVGGTTTSRTVEFTPFFSGIALDVTPQIDEQGVVTLHVHPTVSEVRDDVKTLEFGNNETETFPLALSSVREADSIVRARSGQIVVIGGLMQENSRDDRFGVPLLSRLPLVGFLFRQTRTASRKSELVILLKPLVVESDEQWAEEVRRRELRVEEVKEGQRSWWN